MARSLSSTHPDVIWYEGNGALAPDDTMVVPLSAQLARGVRYHLLVVAQQQNKVNGPVAEIEESYIQWEDPIDSNGILSIY